MRQLINKNLIKTEEGIKDGTSVVIYFLVILGLPLLFLLLFNESLIGNSTESSFGIPLFIFVFQSS